MASEDHGNGPGPADPTPRRVASSSKRTATARRRAIVGGVVALLVAGGAVLLFTGGEGGPLPGFGPIGDDEPETPEFAFDVRRVVAQTTTETAARKLRKETDAVADEVKATLDELYFDGYVEPDTWGDFGEIEGLFDGDARDQAETDLDTLTLGTGGSESFRFVEPGRGTLMIDVLTDQADRPVQALAIVSFTGTAEAETEGDPATEIRSSGSFFLHHVDGGWKIYAYRVERNDKAARTPTASSTASATASPEGDEG